MPQAQPRSRNRKTRNGLTRSCQHGPPGHREAVKRARKAEELLARRAKAWRLFVDEGLTFMALGQRLGVSNHTAHTDVMAVFRSLEAGGFLNDADLLRTRQQANIRRVIGKHLTKADRVESARVVLQALDREARLNGLDRHREGPTPDQMLAMIRGIVADLLAVFTETAQRQAIRDAFQRRLGATVDVPQPKNPDQDAA